MLDKLPAFSLQYFKFVCFYQNFQIGRTLGHNRPRYHHSSVLYLIAPHIQHTGERTAGSPSAATEIVRLDSSLFSSFTRPPVRRRHTGQHVVTLYDNPFRAIQNL